MQLKKVLKFPSYLKGDNQNLCLNEIRNELLKNLQSNQIYDIFVIGGGASGCGVALDASLKGL